MPNKLKTKLKENEFYCVGHNKRASSHPEDMCVVQFKNGAIALKGYSEKFECVTYKFIKTKDANKMIKKYGEC